MNERVRMRVTMTFEYDATPEHYPSPDPAAMALVDQEAIGEDPGGYLAGGHAGLEVRVEPVSS